MNKADVKDKGIFIIGFLAVFLSLVTFRTELSHIVVVDGPTVLTLWKVLEFLLGMLILSVYLYALTYTQSSFGKYRKHFVIERIYKIILFSANFCYSVGIILPLLIVLLSIFLSSPLGEFGRAHETGLFVFDAVGAVFVIILSVLNAKSMNKEEA